MQQTDKAYDLFISYADADRAWVEGYLLNALQAADISVHTEAAFRLGRPRLLEFERAIQQSARTLLVLSPAYLAEQLNQFVTLLIQNYGLETDTWRVIPLIRQPVMLPTRLAMLHALDATNQEEWPGVVERLAAALGAAVPGSPPIPDCPYPGMAPFGEVQSPLFFGRTTEIHESIEQLRLHPLLTVIGPSGCGKSSLVFAGILPELRNSRRFGQGTWAIKIMRPGAKPLTTLNTLFNGASNEATRTLLVIDQLEELFTLAVKEEKERFQQRLLKLARLPNVYTLLTVRADFYSDLMATALWPQLQAHRLEVTPLGERDLRQAIVGPAEHVGVFVEAALVERLVADAAGEPGVLPLVQETLVWLWDYVDRRFLSLQAYEALVLPRRAYGGPERTGLQVAMARRADAAFNTLLPEAASAAPDERETADEDPINALPLARAAIVHCIRLHLIQRERQAIARRIFLRLIQFGEGRADTRRQQTVLQLQTATEDPTQFEATLQHFVSRRLLTLTQDEKAKVRLVDIAHEALINGWPMLAGWLTEQRIAEQARRGLEAKSAEWQRLGQGKGGLLDAFQLLEAEHWLASADVQELGPSPALLALVTQSRMAIDAAAAVAEAARQRELEQERKLALASQQELAQAQKLSRRQRLVIALSALLLVVAAVSIRWIAQKSRDNRDTRNVTKAQLLRDEENQLPVSLLLAIESIHSSATSEAQELLRYGLALLPMPQYIIQHDQAVMDVAFSPDGKWLASVGEDGVVQVVAAATGKPIATLEHFTPVLAATFSPDSQLLATGDEDGAAHVWDVATSREIVPSMPHEGNVLFVVFSPDGQKLAVAGQSNNAQVWDYRHSEIIFSIAHDDTINAIAFSPNGHWLATAGADGKAKLWNAATGELMVQMVHAGPVIQIVFSPDGRQLATASSDATACVWDATTGRQVGCVNHNDLVEDVAFSPDGQLLATASDDSSVRLWDAVTFRERLRMRHSHAVNRVAFHPTGRWLVTASQDKTARVWDTATGTEVARMIHEAAIENAVFSPNGHLVATAGGDNQARIWNVDLTAEVARFQQIGYVWGAAFNPDGKRLTTATDGAMLATTWAIANERAVVILPKAGVQVGIAATFSPDARYLAMPSRDGAIRIWDLYEKRELTQFVNAAGGLAGPGSLALSADGRWLAAGSDATLRTWEVATRKEILHVPYDTPVKAIAFSTSGQWLASATADGSVHLHEHLSSRATTTLSETSQIEVIAISPDETKLATGGADGFVHLWNIATGKESSPAMLHRAAVTSLSFHPNGQWLATSGADGVTRIWEVATGQEVARIQQRDRVQAVTFSPDGHWLATTSGQVAKVWDFQKLEKVGSEDLIAKVCRRLTRNLSQGEWITYFGRESYRQTCKSLPDLFGPSKVASSVNSTYKR